MDASATAIVDEIRGVFPARRPVHFTPMVNSVQGDEPVQVAEFFADMEDWTELLPEALDRHGSALHFLSDKAIRFYIPAFLVADLRDELQSAEPSFVLVHGFDVFYRGLSSRPRSKQTVTESARARWDGSNQPQAVAVAHYLEWKLERGGPQLEFAIAEALGAYWYVRAAGLAPDL